MITSTDTRTDTRWGTVFLILFAGSVGAAQLGKLPGALPEIRADLDIGLVTAGWIISTVVMIGAAGSIFAGAVGDRHGHRRIFLAGAILIAGGSLWGGFAAGSIALIAGRIIEGVGYIAVIATAPVLIGRATRESDRDIGFGVWAFYMPIGMGTMVALSPFLIAAAGGWRGLWFLNAALALAAFVAAGMSLRGARFAHTVPAKAAGLSDILNTVRRPGPWVLAVGFGAYSLVYLSSMAFLPTFLIEREGFDLKSAAVLIGVAIFMNAPGCFVGGWMMKRGVPAWTGIAVSYAGMAVCAFGLYQADIPFALRYLLAMALPFLGGFIPPIILSRAQVHAPSPALYGTTIGLVIQVISVGHLIGPPIMAFLVASTGNWQSGAWLTVAACGVGLCMAPMLRNLDRRAGLV